MVEDVGPEAPAVPIAEEVAVVASVGGTDGAAGEDAAIPGLLGTQGAGAEVARTTSLIGAGAMDLLGDIQPPVPPAVDETPFVFPAAAPPPVTIPFPTAVHLFVPGAILALYFSRKYRRRRG